MSASHAAHRTCVTAATRVFAVLGDPVAHSLSPVFHNAALQACGLDAVYVALRCSRAAAPLLVDALARAGGGGNVTIPHKNVVVRAIESPTEAVEKTGACNTFWLENGRVCGDNTDVDGFRAAARAIIGSVHGARVLLLGAGGAAAAIAWALLQDDVARLDVVNRTSDRAGELRARLAPDGTRMRVTARADVAGESYDLVVNATSLGLLDGDVEPIDLRRLGRVGAVFDAVYRPDRTRWCAAAESLGIPATDGREMLVLQGAAAFERWWGRPAPIEQMRASLGS